MYTLISVMMWKTCLSKQINGSQFVVIDKWWIKPNDNQIVSCVMDQFVKNASFEW